MGPPTDVDETAREFANRFLDEAFADATALTTDGRTAVVDAFPEEFAEESMDATDALESYWWGLYGQYGPPAGIGAVTVDGAEATLTLDFETGSERATVSVEEGAVTNFSFAPVYEVPNDVDEDAFDEREVSVDAGDVSLDGLLAVPDGTGPFQGVLLVHGAGIHDPDGSAGRSKILKDVAWGLASEGIATLRYEKRLAERDVDAENHTLDRVVVDDAVAAVDELAAAEEVDEDALFVAGHSQGGMCAPRIAARHGHVAGVVVLDGLADPILDPDDVDFFRYEFELDGDLDEEEEAQLDADRETARRIVEGEFEDSEVLWGRPGAWHRSVAEYDPVETLRDVDRPTFVLKTCRADAAIQPELDAWLRSGYEEWRDAALPEGSRVELYEGLDHFFQQGFAPSHPLSLYIGGNVAGEVVADLAGWIRGVAST